jgi:hypothetical protein
VISSKTSDLGLVYFVIIVIIAGVGLGVYGLSAIGVPSAYEGAKPRFLGVFYENQAYEGVAFRGTSMNFDVDDPKTGMPNLIGEMTTIFIPEETSYSQIPEYIPDSWKAQLELLSNPQKDEVYEWEVKEGDETHFYRMEKWLTKWYVSFEAGYDTFGIVGNVEGNNQRLRDMEVWFEIETKENWYFEDAERTYFAIAKIEVGNVLVEGRDTGRIDIIPESFGSSLFLFYEPYGGTPKEAEGEYLGYSVDGTHLNPQLFGRTVYTMVEFVDFGTQAYLEGLNVKNQGDVVTYEFTVHQFVVGKWVVKDIQELPPLEPLEGDEEGYGRTGKVVKAGIQLPDIGAFLRSPVGMQLIFAILVFTVVLWLFLFGGLNLILQSYQSKSGR